MKPASNTQTAIAQTTRTGFALQSEGADDDKELREALCKPVSGQFFDTLTVTFRGKSDAVGLQTKRRAKRDEGATQTDNFAFTITIQTNFYSHENGVFCRHGERVINLNIEEVEQNKGVDWADWRAQLDKRNRELGLVPLLVDVTDVAHGAAEIIQAPALKIGGYNFQTGLESDWLIRAACDGGENYKARGYRSDAQRGALIYEQNGASHRVELTREAPENGGESLEMDALEWLATQQNADFGFTFFYIARLLAPPETLPANRAAVGWIDLDDVAAKIGYDVDGCNGQEREELRKQVWQFINFGARALVIGQRKQYRDRQTGKEIETHVESPPWRVLDVERPVQTAMFGETPRRVQLLISKEWEPLLTKPQLAQYLPFAEIVGSIPANQTAGAWARVLGKALANFWRRLPHQATGISPALRPTRRELLTRYTPKKTLPVELLASDKPKRAVKYWRDALAMLVQAGFLSPEGEPSRSVADMLKELPKYKWQEAWLDESVDLRPGAAELDALRELASAKHNPKPRALGATKRRATRPKRPAE